MPFDLDHWRQTIPLEQAVIGIDRCRLYLHVAPLLTKQATCHARVRLHCSQAESAPFAMSSFDCVWMQHVLLYLNDKARVVAELRRMLVPGGVLALHEIVAPRGGRIRFPRPWAASAARGFVPRPERLRIALESAGFALTLWQDTTPAARDWCARVLARAEAEDGSFIAPDTVPAMRNFADGMAAGTLGVAMAVFHKPG